MPLAIEDYALISDTQTAALVGIDGSIDWLCLPRFDSAACFAALLGEPSNGRWLLKPRGADRAARRRYYDRALVLQTEWESTGGAVRVIDFMPPRSDLPILIRAIQGIRGRVEMEMDLVLRFDYGRLVPWVRRVGGDLCAVAGPDAVCLRTDIPTEGEGLRTTADFSIGQGDFASFVLSWHPSHEAPREPPHAGGALEMTLEWWRAWCSRLRYDGDWGDDVRRSMMVLKALTYAPTGGMVAAPTTSLPEELGGVRNWDYRYCWLRDAAFTLWALSVGGYTDEARAFRNWLLRASGGDPAALQVLYGPAGESRVPELELPWLPGYAASRPVRIGNAAAEQYQLDVYGEVLDAMHLARVVGIETDPESWAMQRLLIQFVVDNWREPDEGIWEVRGPRRQFTHSKVMAWAALDRAVRAVERFGLDGPADDWRRVRQEIHDDVLAHGYDAERNTFTQYFGGKELDASLLMIPLVHFLPASDRRMKGTVEAIKRELMDDGFVMRYRTETTVDGLPSGEGAFLACTFWLVDNLALVGQIEEATNIFERLLALRNDVGLLAEEYDPRSGRLIGNFPQAFTHVGVITSAYNLDRARKSRARALRTM
ncbi:MAG: glycoside hydrolase family 15 protein [Chloroflexota bacterium]|nr:glycoside hydrolase family 15 protein [Chloroflexota bacterium]